MSTQTLMKSFKNSLVPSLALGVFLALPLTAAHAANLDQAKQQGMVCELPTGYLKPTGTATPDVKAMVNDINTKRKAEYERIAKQHNVAAQAVGVLTAKKLEPKCK
jgi:uncharacterized protein YdbL (DUF1318 family)